MRIVSLLLLLVMATAADAQTIDYSGRGQAIVLPSPVKKADTRPILTVFVTDNCGWCSIGRMSLARQSITLPVQVKVIRSGTGKVPSWVKTYPTFYWQAADKTYRKQDGWAGVDELVASWELTQATTKRSGYRGTSIAQWTFPGSTRSDLIEHLQEGQHAGKFALHQLNQMTFQQLQTLHSDDHIGQIRWEQLPARQVATKKKPFCPVGQT